MRSFLRSWWWAVCLISCLSCGQSPQQQLSKAAGQLADCASEEVLTETEQLRVRADIDADAKIQKIDAIFQQKVREGLNGNVLIAQKGVVLYKRCFGLAHFEKSSRDSLCEDSKFQLASLSKTFTAVAALKLIETGKLSLDDSIQRFFPDFPYHGISIRHLLSHRSGLPNYAYMFDDSMKHNFYNHEKPYPTNAVIMHWMATKQPRPKPYNQPGRSFSYSNTNYMVLASIIEQASGQPFSTFVRQNILEPIGMRHTYIATTRNDSINRLRTAGYQWNRRIPKDYFDDVVGDKGVYSTTGDLFRWYRALNGECLLKRQTLAEAFLPRSFERKGARNYGYGFRMQLDASNQPAYIYHTGWWKGYNTMFWFSPKDEYVIIILGNRYNRTVYGIGQLLDVLRGRPNTGPTPADETGEVEI